MKAVMISIRPEWCAKIANGKKTIEVRKTKPKLETPFKCYIYATKSGDRLVLKDDRVLEISKSITGKVIGEFFCNVIVEYTADDYCYGEYYIPDDDCIDAGLTRSELWKYGNGKTLYGWLIDGLVIYDKPKELSEFYVWKKCNSCRKSGYESTACGYDEDCKVPAIITRAPQSWCYVEEHEA